MTEDRERNGCLSDAGGVTQRGTVYRTSRLIDPRLGVLPFGSGGGVFGRVGHRWGRRERDFGQDGDKGLLLVVEVGQ
jgi:hypothetical protein